MNQQLRVILEEEPSGAKGGLAMFKVESDIPVPPKVMGTKAKKYPWDDMEVGDSFFVPNPPGHKRNPLYTSAQGRNAQATAKYSCRAESDGVRVWRVE